MALFDYAPKYETEGETNKQYLTLTVGIQDHNRIMVMLVDDKGKTTSGFTFPLKDGKIFLSLLETAIKSLEAVETE